MEKSIIDITLELAQSHCSRAVTVKRGDTHRTLRIHLSDGGKPYPVTPLCHAVFTAAKPDGSHLFNDCRVEGQTVLYDLTPQTTALPGDLECELRLYDDAGALLTSASFVMTVSDTVYADGDEQITSTGEATALTKLLTDAEEKLSRMDSLLKNEVNYATIDDSTVGADAWSSKQIVDKLCPGFTAEGTVAVCQPLAEYPLQVVTTMEARADGDDHTAIHLTHCGKNLFDFKQGVYEVNWIGVDNIERNYFGYEIHLPAGTYTLHAEKGIQASSDYIYGVVNKPAGGGESFLLVQGANTNRTYTVALEPGDTIYIYDGYKRTMATANDLFARNMVQIEAGSVATAYEPYHGQTYTMELGRFNEGDVMFGSYNWQTGVLDSGEHGIYQHDPETDTFTDIEDINTYVPPIVRKLPALPGTNCLWSDCGNTAVTGVADPVVIIEKLTNAVIALGGNI